VILGNFPNTVPSGGLIKTGAARVGAGIGEGGDAADVGVDVGGDVGVAAGVSETRGAVSEA
jgi:hypothetical protein